MNLHEQARAEAERMAEHVWAAWTGAEGELLRGATIQGYLAGHEAAHRERCPHQKCPGGSLCCCTDQAATRTRVVTTVTELDALLVGSVVRVKHLAYIKYAPRAWIGARNRRVDALTLSAFAPLTVLYDPEENR